MRKILAPFSGLDSVLDLDDIVSESNLGLAPNMCTTSHTSSLTLLPEPVNPKPKLLQERKTKDHEISQLRKENQQLKEKVAEYEEWLTKHDDAILDVKARIYRFSKYERILDLLDENLLDKGYEI